LKGLVSSEYTLEQITLSGTYQELGQQQGHVLKQHHFSLPPPDPQRLRFEILIKRDAPELLVEIRGIAESTGVEYDAILTLIVTAPFESYEISRCTVLAILPERTLDHRVIVGRNYDFFHDVSDQGATTYWTYPKDRYASLGNCDIFVGREDGLNEAGLFVAQARFFFSGTQPGITFWLILRLLLDRCATVRAALKLLERLPHAQSFTYLLADKSGEAVVVEPTIEGLEVRYPEDGVLILTNHAMCERWKGRERFIPPDSYSRYRRILQLTQKRKVLNVETVKAILRDHEGLICSHGVHMTNRKFGTIWSLVGQPGVRQLALAQGHPCQNHYTTQSF
jgi:predicted choloylglycine hydrolase